MTRSGDGYFTVNITAIKDKDENDEGDSTGYVFHLDAEGELVLCTKLCPWMEGLVSLVQFSVDLMEITNGVVVSRTTF